MKQFVKNAKAVGKYLASFAQEIHSQGYTRYYARYQIQLIDDFSQWLRLKEISLEEITLDQLKKYLQYRLLQQRSRRCDSAILRRFLRFLHQEGVIVEKMQPVVQTPIDLFIAEFVLYLQKERALACKTIILYQDFASRFLRDRFANGEVNLSALCAADIIDFVQHQASCLHIAQAKQMITALRSLLQYAQYQGYINIDLAASVPAVANWSKSTIPKALPPDQVELVLASCNRQTAVGRRDYAILLLLARLGLRAGEIVALSLDDIDWQAGVITVLGKGNHLAQLPLPIDVGQAIATYLQKGRPQTTSRSLFLRAKAPISGFKESRAVSSVVEHALARAGINASHKGAHQFRHSLATEMLRQGTSLAEIGEVLRHRNAQTTEIYVKVDLVSLHKLALPWPGGK